MTSRRSFLVTGAAAVASAVASTRALGLPSVPSGLLSDAGILPAPDHDAFVEELAMEALNAARDAGASYADARIGRYRRQNINTRERAVTGVNDSESYGIGIRCAKTLGP